MNGRKLFLILKKIWWSILYGALFIYTLTFPTPVSWVVFYFFTVILLASLLSTFILWGKAQFEVSKNQQHELNSQLNLKTKGFLPILIPYLTIVISVKEKSFSTEVPSLFKHKVSASFSAIHLPRGNHKKLLLRTSGKDILGFFTHQAKKQIPVDLEIYPDVIYSTLLHGTVKKLDAKLELKRFSAQDAANFRQLREHQQQDALKDIDWKTSFKKQTLMVKDYDQETNTPLNLIFLGYQSPQFEELLSLTYSLYLELSRFQNIQLFIVGEYDEQLLLQQGGKNFLTVQPTTRLTPLLSVWDNQLPKNGKKIIVAPDRVVSSIEDSQVKTSFFLSEDTLTNLHIGGN
ncbi:DUF58 domain-containing protein [Desemzia sp. RIT804]|uniref:DUF58 domain-containing protein n=1 Tax=Desemzia sp. RIT 804 TaxID=2810209 RepID=UPI0019525F51|nr:DUF58 domain-containing protein [Desemzia sp. RIT 804]MBM6615768.1 DUF58 domain-containing protein [Desemzia sp. RIT 804]